MSDRFTEEQLAQIREIAADTGVCPTCLQSVSVNLYGVSPTMVETLKQMARITEMQIKEIGERAVDVRKTSLDHNHRSSLSKLRQHGLIAKVKGDNDRQIAGHWVVTRKGYDFLAGSSIDAKVEIFDNTVLGHTGGTVDIHEVLKADKLANDPDLIENKKIGVGEAAALGNLRAKPERGITKQHRAEFKGSKHLAGMTPGEHYDIEIGQLTTGRPIQMFQPFEHTYPDVSAFMRDWKITQ